MFQLCVRLMLCLVLCVGALPYGFAGERNDAEPAVSSSAQTFNPPVSLKDLKEQVKRVRGAQRANTQQEYKEKVNQEGLKIYELISTYFNSFGGDNTGVAYDYRNSFKALERALKGVLENIKVDDDFVMVDDPKECKADDFDPAEWDLMGGSVVFRTPETRQP